MRAIRALSAALLGVGALALPACTSAGDGGDGRSTFGYKLDPETVNPGGRIALPVENCKGNATVFSGVFDTVTIPEGRASATATIDRDAKVGTTYDVTFRCGEEYGHKKLAITGARSEREGNAGPRDSGGGGYGGNGNGGGGGGGNGGGGGGGGYGGNGNGNGNGGYGGTNLGGFGVGGGGGGNSIGGYGGNGGGGGGGNGGGGGGNGYEQHGVRAGVGGTSGGFDPKKVGLGALLIAGTIGTAWHMAHRRTAR
ncbi:hypothetical protein ACWEQ1_28630 [Streptomyces nodosus]